MNSPSTALFVLSLSSFICQGDLGPSECYICQSRVWSNICGDGFLVAPSIQYCKVSQPYCIKVIEIAGRRPMVYRKCSYNDCTQEEAIREGTVQECAVCDTRLCNGVQSISPFLYLIVSVICLSLAIL